MKILQAALLTAVLISCKRTDSSEKSDKTITVERQTHENEAYAQDFVKKAKGSNGLLLPGIRSLIKNKETAVAVAEAVLFKIYGEENIRRQRPYSVYKTDHYWVITGTLPEETSGGVFEIALDAKDARVIGLSHGK